MQRDGDLRAKQVPEVSGMPYPTIDLNQKKVILLSGYQKSGSKGEEVKVLAIDKLRTEADRNRDAVAFCYFYGIWRASA